VRQKLLVSVTFVQNLPHKQLSEVVRTLAIITIYGIELCQFDPGHASQLAERLEALTKGSFLFATQASAILALRSDFHLAKRLIRKCTDYILSELDKTATVFQVQVATTGPAFQRCFLERVTPALINMPATIRTVSMDVFAVARNAKRSLIVDVRTPEENRSSRAVRFACLLASSVLTNGYSAAAVAGLVTLVVESPTGVAGRQAAALAQFTREVQAVKSDASPNARSLGLAAADFAIEFALGAPDRLICDSLLGLLDLLEGQAGTADGFLLFRRCAQVACLQAAQVAVRIVHDLVIRLPYTITREPPRSTRPVILCVALENALDAVQTLFDVDLGLEWPAEIEFTLVLLKSFCKGRLRVEDEYFEVNVKRACRIAIEYLREFTRIGERWMNHSWQPNLTEEMLIVTRAQARLAEAKEGGNGPRMLGRELFRLVILASFVEGVPAALVTEMEESALTLSKASDDAPPPETLAVIEEQLAQVKQGFEKGGSRDPCPINERLPERADLLEKLTVLRLETDSQGYWLSTRPGRRSKASRKSWTSPSSASIPPDQTSSDF
jgi:hypothetical protein